VKLFLGDKEGGALRRKYWSSVRRHDRGEFSRVEGRKETAFFFSLPPLLEDSGLKRPPLSLKVPSVIFRRGSSCAAEGILGAPPFFPLPKPSSKECTTWEARQDRWTVCSLLFFFSVFSPSFSLSSGFRGGLLEREEAT